MLWKGNAIQLGSEVGKSHSRPLTLTALLRSYHAYVAGGTGTGKSKLLEWFLRQDIWSWCKSKCGLLLLSWHDDLYDNTVRFLAEGGYSTMPVVLVDFRKPDSIIGYNPLRQRPGDRSAIVEDLATGIIHAWGEGTPTSSPRTFKALQAILGTLYFHGLPITAARKLITSSAHRDRLVADLPATSVERFAWETMPRKGDRFSEELEGAINRLGSFTSGAVVQRAFSFTGPGLDLASAMEDGAIVLVCLSTTGNPLGHPTAKLIGSLMLSDLWNCGRGRGKGTDKPFYVYLDEFQNFINPAMAQSLDEARGYGLHMTMAQQYPTQLRNDGPAGQSVYDSVLTNARARRSFSSSTTLMIWRPSRSTCAGVRSDWTRSSINRRCGR
ncbi:MAG: TraM recognition domain-containing protein [Tepidisphaeraceae bacterium]